MAWRLPHGTHNGILLGWVLMLIGCAKEAKKIKF
jgi:hypothetical protein